MKFHLIYLIYFLLKRKACKLVFLYSLLFHLQNNILLLVVQSFEDPQGVEEKLDEALKIEIE